MPFIKCSSNCVISNSTDTITFAITDTKLYLPVLTLSIQDNTKILQQLKPGFKSKLSWNKYQLKVSIQTEKKCLDYLIDRNFQGANKLFLPFVDDAVWTGHTYIFKAVKIKYIEGEMLKKSIFDKPMKYNIRRLLLVK